jgi:hypothetical protein
MGFARFQAYPRAQHTRSGSRARTPKLPSFVPECARETRLPCVCVWSLRRVVFESEFLSRNGLDQSEQHDVSRNWSYNRMSRAGSPTRGGTGFKIGMFQILLRTLLGLQPTVARVCVWVCGRCGSNARNRSFSPAAAMRPSSGMKQADVSPDQKTQAVCHGNCARTGSCTTQAEWC